MHLLYNLDRIPAILAKLLAAMAYYKLYTKKNLRGIIFYASMSKTDRKTLWKDHYGAETDPMDGYE